MCTGIHVISKNDNNYWGRTQEFNIPLPVEGIIVPRGELVDNTLTPIECKYTTAGISIDASILDMEMILMMDGINEKGLTGGSFYFGNEYNKYISKEDIKDLGKIPLRGEEFVTWALLNCKSVRDLKEKALHEVAIAKASSDDDLSLPQHYGFVDSNGDSIVIEPSTPGGFKIYDNPVGTITNQPEFPWHITNLQNYVGMTTEVKGRKKFGNLKSFSSGKGNGLFGLPGDFTPQSRFIRATILNNMSFTPDDDQAISKIFHILNSFDIPKGIVDGDYQLPKEFDFKKDRPSQYTQYTSAYDIKNKEVYISNYENRAIQRFKMDDINIKKIKRFKIDYEETFIDMEEK